MSEKGFVHLHVHSEFSMLDGAARIKDAVETVIKQGQTALGLTDHGVLYGAVDLYETATKAGIKPILGVEGYLTPGSRFDRPTGRDNIRHHITLLAETQTGYSNLVKLVSRAFLEGYYYKPRMDIELLAEYSEGLIATSGCLSGHIPSLLAPDVAREEGSPDGPIETEATPQPQNGDGFAAGLLLNSEVVPEDRYPIGRRDMEGAVEAAAGYQDIFGKDRFFIELHNLGLPSQQRILPDLVEISKRIGAPLLATNDTHYTRKDEAAAHDALLCIQTGSTIDDPKRSLRFDGQEFYLKTPSQMRDLFPENTYPGACDNTLWIAERAKVKIDFDKLLLPHFAVPDGYNALSYLKELIAEGARMRYGESPGPVVEERIGHELGIIEEMGFPDYFLIVWDLVRYAKSRRIRVGPGRGSAAGSIVAYTLGITELDPIEYGLIFERFLNPGRRQMPDIDIDFDERFRADVIRYAADKYGSDHLAQIVTFSTIKGKQAIRDSARVLGFPYKTGDDLAKLMPDPVLGREASLDQCFDQPGPETDQVIKDWYTNAAGLREEYETQPDARRVVDTARGLEGLRRQDSIHAAAVVIAPHPLVDLVPVQRKGEDAEVVTQYEMHALEKLGLLKMDILGLRTLSTIDRTLDLIRNRTGTRLEIEEISLQDPETYEMLCRGDTIGVFQLEGTAMRTLIRSLRPDRFEDLIALVALYRPGPMSNDWHNAYAHRKNGRSPIDFPHPATQEVLGETYGLMIYQEQVMQIARDIAGYSMADADSLRKAMGKKIPDIMAKERDKFVNGVVAGGNEESFGGALFDSIEGFAGYGFNKSHSAAYGLLAYQTAYLKRHYPSEYMAALLTSSHRDKDRARMYLGECRLMGLEVKQPSVNLSESEFTVRDGMIVFGLAGIRNVGTGVVEKITEARDSGPPFADFQDFVNRVDSLALNKRVVASLISAGAFDDLGHSRKGLNEVSDLIIERTLARRKHEDAGQFSFFGGEVEAPDFEAVTIPREEWNRPVKLAREKEMLGLYVTGHPLQDLETALAQHTTVTVTGLAELDNGSRVTVGGIVRDINRRYMNSGDSIFYFMIEDMENAVEVVAFPSKHQGEVEPLIRDDAILVVTGRLQKSGEELKLRANRITRPKLLPDSELTLRLEPFQALEDMESFAQSLKELREVLSHHPGSAPVYVQFEAGDLRKMYRLDDKVELNTSLYAQLRGIFGETVIV
ncbi:MAG: DNA polymerase III subunit alpha [bacterium]|nr:DNA polymerase III subunit alpha [bacterium]MDE0643235.1 DNA polymerase III subunit alpha [bacterium]